MDNYAAFRQRAAEEREAAQAADLDHVKERCLRSALAYERLADRGGLIPK